MSKVLYATSGVLNRRVGDYIRGINYSDDVYDLLDDIQLAYNDGLLDDEDYQAMMDSLEGYIGV